MGVRLLMVLGAVVVGVAGAAADVISVNFASTSGAASVDADVGLVAGVPGSSWNNLTGATGTNTTLRSVDQTAIEGLKLTWSCQNGYSYATGVTDNFLKGYLDDTNDKIQIKLEGIPFAHYDVIVYMANDNGNKKLGAVQLNGTAYYADAETGLARLSCGSRTSWGRTQAKAAAWGVNALRLNGLGTSTLSIVPIARDYQVFRCSVAAIQIVENTSDSRLMSPDFAWSGTPGESPTGWITSFGQNSKNYYRVGPLGKDVFATRNGNAPYAGKGWSSAFSICFYADISDIGSTTKDAMILDIGGITSSSSHALALLRTKGTDDIELSCVNGTGGGTFTKTETSVSIPNITPGYHLFFVTFSTSDGISLRVDDGETVSLATSCTALSTGLQIGDTYGGQGTAVAATNMGVAGIWGWDYILSEDEKDQLLLLYADGRVGAPMLYDASMDSNHNGASIFIPTMTATKGVSYGVTAGTAYLQPDRVLTVPQLRLGYANSNLTAVVNIYGTVNITSTSTTARVTDEIDSFRGSALAGKKNTCTLNVKAGGQFNSPDAYLCLNAFGSTASTSFGVDGFARVRGFFLKAGSSTINVRNGGVLEVADFYNGSQSLNCGAGTIRAVPYTNGSPVVTGWTHPAAAGCTFYNTDVGTTIDVNGLTNTLASIVTGTGMVIVADSSVEKGGKLIITQMPSFAGKIVVQDGAELDIGSNRPRGTFQFAEGSRLVFRESLFDTNGIARLSFTGSPSITMYRADGTTVVEDAAIVAEEGTTPYIRYTPTSTPVVSGEGCWLDFEFDDYSYTSTGYNKLTLTQEGDNGIGRNVTHGDFKDAYSIYAASQVYMTLVYPSQWSAAIYATVPNYPNAAVMTFGTCADGLIGLIGGDNDNEVKLVRTTGNSKFITLATMSVPNAATAQHLYVFTKEDRTISIYLDGVLWQTYTSDTDITIGRGFQMASVHGGTNSTGIRRFGNPDIKGGLTNELLTASYVGMLRMYEVALSGAALSTLAAEFPYISPNGLYARTLTGGAETWTAENAWTLMAETEADRTQANAPAASAALQIAGAADGTSALTVDLAEETRFESLTVGGAGAVRFVHGADAATAVNEGKTVLNVDTTIEYGALSVNGGPLSLADGATLTFDWRAFPTTHELGNQTNQLTGITHATNVVFLQPTNTLGRTFTCFYNADNSTWSVAITRPAYDLAWKGSGTTWWTASTLWRNTATGEDAAFLPNDSVRFPDTSRAVETINVSGTKEVQSVSFDGTTTDYALLGGTLNVFGLTSTASASVALSNTVSMWSAATLTFGSGPVDLHDLRTYRRNSISFADGTGETLARIGDGGTSNVFNNITFGTGRRPVYDARSSSNQAYVYGAITVPESETFVKTGAGKFDVLGDSPDFRGEVRIEGGQILLHANLRNVTATQEKPIRIQNGSLYVTCPNDSTLTHQQRLPDQAWIDVGAGGKFEAAGDNPFSSAAGMGPTIVAHDGGIAQFNGENAAYDVRVERVELVNAQLSIARTTANAGGHTVQIMGGTIVSGGDSQITQQSESSGTINVQTLAVTNGTLTLGARASANVSPLVKTGAGALVLDGAGGCAATARHLEIAEGSMVANGALASNIQTLTLGNGASLDLSGCGSTFNASATLDIVVAADTTAFIDTGDRDLAIGEKVLAWGAQGEPAGRFRLRSGKHHSYTVSAKADGLYVMDGGTMFIFR